MVYVVSVAVLTVFVGVIVVAALVSRASREAGPEQLGGDELAATELVHRATPDDPGDGSARLGSATSADGLALCFSADDAPEASATLVVPAAGRGRLGPTFAHRRSVRLTEAFADHHVQTRGFVACIRVRGAGDAVGREIRLLMKVSGAGVPYGVTVENDDDTDAAVGGRLDFEHVEVRRVADARARARA